MKFTVDRDVFVAAVSFAVAAVSDKVPVLSGVMLEADMDLSTLHVYGFDYETSAEASVEAKVEDSGKILVPGRVLAGICKELPKKPVEITDVDGKITLACGSSKFTLARLPVEDYPALPVIPTAIGTVESSVFCSAVNRVAVAAATETTVPKLMCVFIDFFGDGRFSMCATDRYRLTVDDGIWEPADSSEEINLAIPAKSLRDAAKTLSGEVSIYANVSSGQATVLAFGDSRYTITCSLMEENPPVWAALMPPEFPVQITVDTAELASAIRRIDVVNESNKPVKFSFLDGELFIESTAGENAGTTSISVHEGSLPEDFVAGFNPKYFREALSTIFTDRVLMKFSVPRKPCFLVPVDDEGTELDGFMHLVMPQGIR